MLERLRPTASHYGKRNQKVRLREVLLYGKSPFAFDWHSTRITHGMERERW